MIPVSRKFPLRTEFLSFRRRAKRLVGPHTNIYHLGSNSSTRMAVIVPKKVNSRSATRNWLRRLTYDTLWPQIEDKNLDCVVVYKPLSLIKSSTTKAQIVSILKSLEFNKA